LKFGENRFTPAEIINIFHFSLIFHTVLLRKILKFGNDKSTPFKGGFNFSEFLFWLEFPL